MFLAADAQLSLEHLAVFAGNDLEPQALADASHRLVIGGYASLQDGDLLFLADADQAL